MTKRAGEALLGDLVGIIAKHLKKGERVRIAGLGIAKSENAQLERLNGQRSNAGAAPASIWHLQSAPPRAFLGVS